ncbi:hypothetical protein PGT21_036484 [Puccinia graminis f. sp. tritici]|uniref:Uncharacterized protein n=1 Tax=Puccinia graminis f. sp. tritici TaxID=56615 RepID=A0A5B0NT22_PUCGR|nr:hypothetical protein PGTUg99_037603 [Puccinia graminis f. sp. tritici]KAA1091644.1 hypothetical protein PGT21_036484 [Puccinia graminis f. sp. tritici]
MLTALFDSWPSVRSHLLLGLGIPGRVNFYPSDSAIRPSRTAELDGPHPGTAHKYYAFQMLIGDGTILNHDRPAAPMIHLVPREHRATLPGAPNTSSFLPRQPSALSCGVCRRQGDSYI